MAADRHDLVRRTAGLGQPPACCLAQAVRTEAMQAALIAHLAKPVPKGIRCEWPSRGGCQKGQMLRWGCVERGFQFRVHWYLEGDAGLALADAQHAIMDVLAPHADDIAAALRRAEQ